MNQIVFISPSKYVQGKNALQHLGKHVKPLGKKPLILSDEIVWEITNEAITTSLNEEQIEFFFIEFNGESSLKEIERIAQEGSNEEVDFVIGVGGGKTIDTAKAVTDELDVPVVIVP